MKKVKWLINDIGVFDSVYKDILQHCKDLEYDTSGFKYYIAGSFDSYNQVLKFAIEKDMIKPMDLVELNTNDIELHDFISDLTFSETKNDFEFVFSGDKWFLLRV
jgi:hypothetical protein